MSKYLVDGDAAEAALEKDGIKVVKVFATWCGPCKMLAPITDELSKEYEVYEIDADKNKDLVKGIGVKGLPTLFMMNGKKIVETFEGYVDEETLRDYLKNI